MIFVQDLSFVFFLGVVLFIPSILIPRTLLSPNWLRRLRQLEQLMAKAMLIAIVDLARLLVKTEAQVKQIFIFTEPTKTFIPKDNASS